MLKIFTQNVAGGQVQNSYGNLNIHGLMSQIDVLLQRYSSWSRLLKVMSWVLHFVKQSRKKVPAYLKSSTLQLVEIQQTSQEIVWLVQRQHFNEEYLCLKEGRQVKCNSKLANLSPILIDDIIRMGGRIHCAPRPSRSLIQWSSQSLITCPC